MWAPVNANFYRYLTSLELLLHRGLQCRSLVSNPKAQLKIQLLGSTKNMLHWRRGRDSFHFCSFQTLWQVSGCLTAYLPENWVAGQLKCPFLHHWQHVSPCLLDVEQLWHLSLLWTEARHGLVALYRRPQPYWQYATIWVNNNNIPSCLSNCERDPGLNSFLSASPTGSMLFPIVCWCRQT